MHSTSSPDMCRKSISQANGMVGSVFISLGGGAEEAHIRFPAIGGLDWWFKDLNLWPLWKKWEMGSHPLTVKAAVECFSLLASES